ncbi:MAG: PEP/pyruvate-binding domain-containing protein [Desulfatiglandaceae bacterium]
MKFFRKIFSNRSKEQSLQQVYDAESERKLLKLRYNRFKSLLNANDKVLAAMAEIESALEGTRFFGMDFVRSRATTISAGVFQAVKYLNDLASDGKFDILYNRFDDIKLKMMQIINVEPSAEEAPLVIPLLEIDRKDIDQVGVKMANLGEAAKRLGMDIPEGFTITAASYQAFIKHNNLKDEFERRKQAHGAEGIDGLYRLSSSLQKLIMEAPVPENVASAVEKAAERLKSYPDEPLTLAVRSSGMNEDLQEASFAGQYRSVLNVSPSELLRAYKEIVASKYSTTAMTYRLNRGLRDEDAVMCVGCMKMVDAVAGGVAYSRDPLGEKSDTLIINSAWGLPKLVVDGRSNADRFVVSRSPELKIIQREIADKTMKYTCNGAEGVCRLDLSAEDRLKPSISDEQVLALARAAVASEDYYREPQDIEWAVTSDGRIICLQCRPLRLTPAHIKNISLEDQDNIPLDTPLLQDGFGVSHGAAAGPVQILNKDADVLGFPQGAVMVVTHPLPKWAVLMGRISAVIAEYGSVTSHLANVAREFKLPAVFGMKDATKKLSNGQLVTVDSDSGRVYDGKIDQLLEISTQFGPTMSKTPVYQTLERISRHILPLTLRDPDAPDFRAENCKTLHDLARYCHENAVREMFRFSSTHPFPHHAAKQMLCEIPMQWWVLNLDDGFVREIDSPGVHFEDIVSIPMRALWEGITIIPWEGPPPIDGKGLMSVMFEATKNTSLIPGVPSRYAERNYFMIAKHYCSLNSRFGFHFAGVESYVGERIPENYIHFRFKGGAADNFRKKKRVQLIEEILTDWGFVIEVTEDVLWARFEDQPQEVMRQRLRILGFLIMHTRQLDMVMSNEKMVSHYKKRIQNTINELFPQEILN